MEVMGIVVLIAVLGIPLVGLVALVMGIVALVRINRSGGALRGRGLAVAAIVLGGLMLLATPLLLLGRLLLRTPDRPRPVDEVVITTDVTREKPPAYNQERKRDIFESPAPGAQDE